MYFKNKYIIKQKHLSVRCSCRENIDCNNVYLLPTFILTIDDGIIVTLRFLWFIIETAVYDVGFRKRLRNTRN